MDDNFIWVDSKLVNELSLLKECVFCNSELERTINYNIRSSKNIFMECRTSSCKFLFSYSYDDFEKEKDLINLQVYPYSIYGRKIYDVRNNNILYEIKNCYQFGAYDFVKAINSIKKYDCLL
jgi:hypothetical protein